MAALCFYNLTQTLVVEFESTYVNPRLYSWGSYKLSNCVCVRPLYKHEHPFFLFLNNYITGIRERGFIFCNQFMQTRNEIDWCD